MNPGEIVEIRTPNAVTAVRGTVVVAEVWPGATVRSTITVLRGLVDVARLDTGTKQPVGRAVDVAVRQTITVTGALPLSRPTTITADEANRLTAEFRMLPSTAPSASAAPAVQTAVERAAIDAEALVSSSTAAVAAGSTTIPRSSSSERIDDRTGETSGSSSSTSPSGTSGTTSNTGRGTTSGGASASTTVTTPIGVTAGTSVSGQGASVNVIVKPPVPVVVPTVNTTVNTGSSTTRK